MTNIVLPSAFDDPQNAWGAQTLYVALGTTAPPATATEAQAQTIWQDTGVFSNMYVHVTANNSSNAGTLTYRVGGANGNQTISVGATTTGELTDTTHTDSVSPGNSVNYKYVSGNGSNTTIPTMMVQFSVSGFATNKLGTVGPFTDTSVNTSYYNSLVGELVTNTTEANTQYTNQTAATLDSLYVYVTANTASVATVTSRINAANGNLIASITAGATGFFQDTSHTDTLSNGSLVNTLLKSTVTTSLAVLTIAVDHTTSNNETHYIAGYCAGETQGGGANNFSFFGGDLTADSEAIVQITTGLTWTASLFQTYIISSSGSGSTTMTLRLNGAAGNSSLSVAAGASGSVIDGTHTDSITATTKVNTRTQGGGTTTVTSFQGVLATFGSSPPPPTNSNFLMFM